MYKKLKRGKIFLKDLKRISLSNDHYSRYVVFLSKLISDEQLPPEAKDHPLKGNWQGFRELHISGDLLLVYKVTDNTLYLTRIGSHSQIFE